MLSKQSSCHHQQQHLLTCLIFSGVWCPDWAFWSHRILTNDIAILELTRAVPPSTKIRPINLARTQPGPGITAWVGGWGLDGRFPTPTLNVAPMAVQKDNFRECKQQMAPGKMCAVGKDFGGPCPGDSGSPLVVYDRVHGPTLVGLVSNGAESCKDGLPGIFTRVSYYLDWIHLAMDKARTIRSPFNKPEGRFPQAGFVPRLGYRRRHAWMRDSHEDIHTSTLPRFHSQSKPQSNQYGYGGYPRYKHEYK